jgi:hypothetical protein
MLYLKQSTASQSVLIGPFIDDTDGKTAETGLTIANTDIRLSKNGGNMAAKNSGGGTHDEAGWYAITLDATDTDTVGRLQASVDVAGALSAWAEFQVVEEDTYTWFFASGAAPDTQVAAIKSDTAVIGAAGAGLTDLGGMSTGMKSEVESEANDALVVQKLDHLVAQADGDDPVNGSIMAHLVSATEDWSTFVPSTDSLQAIRDRGDAEWVTATGFALANVLGALNDGAAADEVTTGDTVMQYIKQLINILVGAPGVVTLKAAAAPASGVSLSEMIRAIYDDSNSLDGTKIPDTLSLANINAEVDTALRTTTDAEPSSVPAATATIVDKLGWLMALARNKGTQTSTTKTLRNDADDGDIATSAISSDGTTFTRGEWS